MPRVAVLGAAGDTAAHLVRALTATQRAVSLVLIDRDQAGLQALAAELPREVHRRLAAVDALDGAGLADHLGDVDLVVNGIRPWRESVRSAVQVCLELGVDYLDFADDAVAAAWALAQHEAASERGVRLLIGAGMSPGLSNILARELADLVDEVQDVDVGFCHTEPVGRPRSTAALYQTLLLAQGRAGVWEDGEAAEVPAFGTGQRFRFASPIGEREVRPVAHPEALTLPRNLAGVRNVQCLGGRHPRPADAVLRNVGQAVGSGELSVEDAIDVLKGALAGRAGSRRVRRVAKSAVRRSVRSGELSAAEARRYVWGQLRAGRFEPDSAGVVVHLRGLVEGVPVTLVRRTGRSGPGGSVPDVTTLTALAAAAFVRLALQHRTPAGTHAPESWVEPAAFHDAMVDLGLPRSYVEPVIERTEPISGY
jgi:short subunit dehydrogenase-like uncharacterized protein